ncbi:MAG: ATP-dependent Clp protease proteolytic subunit [Thermomicrobiales bacterium]
MPNSRDDPSVLPVFGVRFRISKSWPETINLTTKLTEILALHTGQEFDRVKRDTERTTAPATEANSHGIVDEVLEPTHKLPAGTNGANNGASSSS